MTVQRVPAASRSASSPGLAVLVCGYAALAAWCAAGAASSALADPSNTDWVAYATGAHLLGSPAMYDAATQSHVVHAVLRMHPSDGSNPFVALPLIAALFWLFSTAGPGTGIVLFALAGICALLAATWLAWRETQPLAREPATRAALILVSVWSLPGLLNVTQWDALLLLPLLLAWRLHRGERDVSAGMLLSTLLLKPQLVWLCVPLLMAGRSWRCLTGLAAGAAGLVVASALIAGPANVVRWAGFALGANGVTAVRGIGLPALAGVVSGLPLETAVALALGATVCVAAFALRSRLRRRRAVLIPLGVLLSVMCAPHVFANDLLVLAPAILWVGRRRPGLAIVPAAGIGLLTLVANHLDPGALRALPVCVLLLGAALVRPKPARRPRLPRWAQPAS